MHSIPSFECTYLHDRARKTARNLNAPWRVGRTKSGTTDEVVDRIPGARAHLRAIGRRRNQSGAPKVFRDAGGRLSEARLRTRGQVWPAATKPASCPSSPAILYATPRSICSAKTTSLIFLDNEAWWHGRVSARSAGTASPSFKDVHDNEWRKGIMCRNGSTQLKIGSRANNLIC